MLLFVDVEHERKCSNFNVAIIVVVVVVGNVEEFVCACVLSDIPDVVVVGFFVIIVRF